MFLMVQYIFAGSKFSSLKEEVVSLFSDSDVSVLACMVTNMVYVIDALARFGVLQVFKERRKDILLCLSHLSLSSLLFTIIHTYMNRFQHSQTKMYLYKITF